jgi:hypothetical protein
MSRGRSSIQLGRVYYSLWFTIGGNKCFWCAVFAGSAGGYAGGKYGGKFGEFVGEEIYISTGTKLFMENLISPTYIVIFFGSIGVAGILIWIARAIYLKVKWLFFWRIYLMMVFGFIL